jgi:hypothetical protein
MWIFLLLPLPLMIWWRLPPYREMRPAIRIPFFRRLAQATGQQPDSGAVVRRRTIIQGILYAVVWCALVLLAIDLSRTMSAEEKRVGAGILLLMLPLLLLAAIAWRFRLTIRSRWQTWQVERRQTEKAHFRRFREACCKNDAKTAYNYLLAWLYRRSSEREASTLRNFLEAAGSEKLSKEVDKLERRLFKKAFESIDQAPWQGKALYRVLVPFNPQ